MRVRVRSQNLVVSDMGPQQDTCHPQNTTGSIENRFFMQLSRTHFNNQQDRTEFH